MERFERGLQFRERCVQRLREERLPQRVLLYVFALFLLSLGVVLAVNADLGVSPIGVMPFVLSLITDLSLGTCTFLVFSLFALLQVLILRKDFQWFQLAQILFAGFFGYFVDFSRFLLGDFYIPSYFGRLLTLGLGMTFTASGVVLHMRARIINMPPAALMLAIATKIPRAQFHQVKIVVDSSLVVLAILLSFLVLGGLFGIREGTVLSAMLTGRLFPIASRLWTPVLKKLGIQTEDAKIT